MNHPEHPTDNQLLDAYARNGDESAFATLARRHMDMLFSVNLRRSRNRQLAEEATQNVLVSLAKKARKLAAQESNLTAWLHQSSRFEIAKLQRREARIHKREQDYAIATMNASDEEDSFARLYPILDQAIDDLRASDREVIVRRYLERQSFSQIGKALGITEDTAQKRTSRAFSQLNQFFKRKAGVTVSAAALAAGISQHCVEAAPVSCLEFASEAASAGLSSTLTTTTITMIPTIAAIVSATAILGGTAVYFINQESAPTATAAAPPSAVRSAGDTQSGNHPNATTVASNTEEEAESYSPNEELAKLEAMNPQPGMDELVRRLALKHAQWLTDLTKELGLSAEQSASLKAVLDARLKTFREALASPEDEMAMITKTGSIIRGIGLREQIAGILSEEQIAGYDTYEGKAQKTQIESFAYAELAKITPVLSLSEDQKDRVFALLQKSSAGKLKADADARALMALQRGQASAQMELVDSEEAHFLHQAFDGPEPMNPTSPEFREKAIDVIGRQIEREVTLLAPVLDDRQKQRYRDHLYQKSILPTLGIKLPTPSEK